MELPIYLDYAATTPVDPRVKEAMLPYFDEIFGNASSNHIYGKQAKDAVEKARKQVSDLINADPEEIIFTSGATEAINLGIKGYWEANREKGNHIITVKTEHKAVLETCKYLETLGVEVTYLGVDENGLICLNELERTIRPDTMLISVMYVNNEIGVIQEIEAIGEIAKDNQVAFFCDATQAIGKIPVDVIKDKIDMLCMSAHKFSGPKGIGALYIREGIQIAPQIHGGGQEKGLRSGTYNTPLIVGFGVACSQASYKTPFKSTSLIENSDILNRLKKEYKMEFINCNNVRYPFIVCIKLLELSSEEFISKNSTVFSISNGSACNNESLVDSHVIKAIKTNSKNTIRFSFY